MADDDPKKAPPKQKAAEADEPESAFKKHGKLVTGVQPQTDEDIPEAGR